MALFSKKSDGKSEEAKKSSSAKDALPAAAPPAPAAPAQTEASAAPVDEAKRRQNAAMSQQAMLSLGEMVSLMMRSPGFQNTPLSAIAGLVAPAIQNAQFMVARAQAKDGMTQPMGACLWATVSPDIDRKLSQDLDKPVQLSAADWKSGDIPWVVLYVGDSRVLTPMLEKLRSETLQGKPLKMRIRGEGGAMSVHSFTGAMPPAN